MAVFEDLEEVAQLAMRHAVRHEAILHFLDAHNVTYSSR